MRERPEGDGRPPSPSDQDPLEELEEELEEEIELMDRPVGADDHTTAAEGLEGDTLDERLAREVPDRGGRRSSEPTTIVDEDGPDDEPELVGEAAGARGIAAPEESAMHVAGEAPGATDHEDDYVED